MRRIVPAALAAAALALALAGCSVSIADPAATDVTVEVSTPDADVTPSGSPSTPARPAPTGTTADDDSAAVDSGSTNGVTREQAIAAASTTVACTPGLVISQIGAVVRVEGACDEVTVNADAAVVVVDDVAKLRLAGSGTVVFAQQVGEFSVVGDASVLRWRGTAPTGTDTGAGNVIERDPS
jgi:hypothetical protein